MRSDQVLAELWRIGRVHASSLLDALGPLEVDGSPETVAAVSEALWSELRRARAALEALAAPSERSPSEIVRNGLSTSRGANLVLWLSLLRTDALNGWLEPDRIPLAGSSPGVWGKGLDAILAVVNEGRNATPAEWAKAHRRAPARWFLAALVSDPAVTAATRASLIQAAARLKPGDAEYLTAGFERLKVTISPLRLSRDELRRCGPVFLEFAAASETQRKWVFAAPAWRAYRRDPPVFLRTRGEVIAAGRMVLQRLGRRDFSAGLTRMLIAAATRSPRWQTRAGAALQRPARDAVYIRHLDLSREQRREALSDLCDSLDPGDRALVDLFAFGNLSDLQTLTRLTVPDIAGLLRSLLRSGWPLHGWSPSEILSGLGKELRSSVLTYLAKEEPDDLQHLLLDGDYRETFQLLREWASESPRNAAYAAGDDLLGRGWLFAQLGRDVVSLLGPRAVVARLKPGSVAALSRRKISKTGRALAYLLADTFIAGDVRDRKSLVEVLGRADGSEALLEYTLRQSVSMGVEPGRCLEALLSSAAAWEKVARGGGPLRSLARRLLQRSDAETIRALAGRPSVRTRLRTLAGHMKPSERRELLQRCAEPLARVLSRREYLRELLGHSVASAAVGRELDRAASVSERRRLLPWVRKEWASTPAVRSAMEIAVLAGARDARYLVALAKNLAAANEREPGTALDDRYHTYQLPKKRGGTRTITVPEAPLRWVQRRVLEGILRDLPVHDAAHGFRQGRSIATNAAPHVSRLMVVNLDIRDFFPSTRYGLVLAALRRALKGQVSEGAMRLLADLCCYRSALPIGAPTSPALANLVLLPVDRALAKASQRFGLAYTRYADDLTFSGHGDTHRVIPFVKRVLADLDYELEPKKVNIFRRGRRQVVTGLVVNDRVNVPRAVRRRLRAAVHRHSGGEQAFWHGRPMGLDELLGRIAALGAVRPDEARQMRETLKRMEDG